MCRGASGKGVQTAGAERGAAEACRGKKRTGRIRGPSSRFAGVPSDSVADHAEEPGEASADEDETNNGDDCDEGKNECVLRETLSFLAVKVEKHGASFRKRRLAFVATLEWAEAPCLWILMARASRQG